MLCRGYSAEAHVYVGKKNIRVFDVIILVVTSGVIIGAQIGLK